MVSLRGIHGYASIKDMLNPDGMQRPETGAHFGKLNATFLQSGASCASCEADGKQRLLLGATWSCCMVSALF